MTASPETTAFVFPGQGSQVVGMGQALAAASAAARDLYRRADEVLGFEFSQLCWSGPETALNDTLNAQPALFVCSLAALAAWQERGRFALPAMIAGHSLGEITGLAAAGAMGFEDGLRLVRERGRLMKRAGEVAPGGMAAILNLDAGPLTEICAEASAATGGVVQVANDNSPGQVVISGEAAALERAMELARANGARRALRLPVSIAAHSPLMQPAVEAFGAALDAVAFVAPRVPVIGNVGVQPLADAAAIRADLKAQLTSPVRWTETIRFMRAQGITTFVEFGSKDVLAGLIRRIKPEAAVTTIGAPEQIQ